MFVVFDIDGTIANNQHRVHHIQRPSEKGGDWPKQDWDAFYSGCHLDQPIEPILAVAEAMQSAGHRIEFWTGRSEPYRRQTEEWIYLHLGLVGPVVRMRPAGDHTADHRLKTQWLNKYGKPDLIFEDRASVVDMWRSHGIICAQVAPGDF